MNLNIADDQWLAAFLRGSKYSLERVKKRLDFHYTVRGTARDLFRITHKDPLFHEILDLGYVHYFLSKYFQVFHIDKIIIY